MDLNSNAFRIVKSLTTEHGEVKPRSATSRAAGKVGGRARAKKLTPEARHDIAVKASRARWSNSK